MKSKTLSRIGIVGGIILAIPLILVTLYICYGIILGCLAGTAWIIQDIEESLDTQRNRRSFDADLWKAEVLVEGAEMDPIRDYMVDDLLDRYDFTGWSESELVELLGEPDQVDRESRYSYYYLGRGFDRLFFKYDQDGLVAEYRIRRYD